MTEIEKYKNAKISSGYDVEPPKNSMALIRNMLARKKGEIEALLPKNLDARRLGILTLKTIRKVPKLMECHPYSLMGAILQAAQLGLEPDGILGHAYLVPFGKEATLMIGYRGMIDIAIRSGNVKSVGAAVIHENDEYEYEIGMEDKFRHKPAIGKDRGDPIAVYAYARMSDGSFVVDVLTIDDVQRAQKASKSQNIWRDHWAEMAKKTAFKRLFKWLPISKEMSTAISLDEQAEFGRQNLGLELQDEDELVQEPITIEMEQKPEEKNEEPIPDKIASSSEPDPPKETKRGRPAKTEKKTELDAAIEQSAKQIEQEEAAADKPKHPTQIDTDTKKLRPVDPNQKSFFGE